MATGIASLSTPEQIDAAVNAGLLSDPVLIARLKAKAGATAAMPVVDNVTEHGPIVTAQDAALKAKADPGAAQAAYLNAKAGGATHEEAIATIGGATPPTKLMSVADPGGGNPTVLYSPSAQPIAPKQAPLVPIGPPGPPKVPPIGPPSPAPMPQPGAAYKGGSGAFGGGPPPAPPQPLDVGNFGKTPHEIEAEKQGQKHAINQLNYQNQASDVEIAQAAEFDAIAQKAAAEADAKARAAEASIAKRKAFLETYNADTMRAIEEYSKAEIDPNKYWADRGTGGAVLAAVGVLLGGLGAAFAARAGKDQSNVGLDMIEKGIQRDIELQKANIAKKGAGIEARKGLYGMYLQQFGSEDAAEAMAYETYLRKTKAQIDAIAAKTTNEQVKIRAAALTETLEDRIIQAHNRNMAAGEKTFDNYMQREAAKREAAANAIAAKAEEERKFWRGIAGGGFKDTLAAFPGSRLVWDQNTHQPIAVVGPNNEVLFKDPDGAMGSQVTTLNTSPAGGFVTGSAQAKSKDHAKEWEKANVAISESLAAVDEAIAMREKLHGGQVFDNGAGVSMGTDLTLKLKAAQEHMSSDKDMAMLQQIAPPDVLETHPVKGLLPGDDPTMTKLKIMKHKLQQKKAINDKTHLKPGQPGTESAPSTLGAPK